MMGTEIFKIDASWAEKLTKTRVQFLLTPTVTKAGLVFAKILMPFNKEKALQGPSPGIVKYREVNIPIDCVWWWCGARDKYVLISV